MSEELWAEAMEMHRIEDRRIGMGEEAEEEMHDHDICRNSHRKYVKGWEDVSRVS